MAKKQTIYEIKVKGLDDIKSLNTEISKLNGKFDDLKKGGDDTTKTTQGFGLSMGKLVKGAAAATAALVAFNKVSKLVTQEIRKSVTVFKSFEFEMAKVKAISGANDGEFRKLNKTAQELGRSTFFTAQQVAALQLNFSKLGFTSAEVLDVQQSALLAATATGEDLARTATVIGSTIRGFGLDATEGARVSDVMAASFTSSALTLEKFQTSMTKVSPVAKLLGMDLEETTAVMGVLTDAGIEASIAGTSLRNIFLKLGDPSSDLAKSIGFTVNSGEDMVREFRRMRDEGVNVEKMLEVVDVRQVAAISTMIEHIDKIESQTQAFRNSEGAASDMADIIGDSLQGATLRFQSALDGLRIVLLDKIAPVLTSVRDGFASMFNAIAAFAETPLSETLEDDRVKLIEMKVALMNTNLEHEKRVKLIEKLKSIYPEYLGNVDSDKIKNDALFSTLEKVNSELANKIILQEHEEKLQERQAQITEKQVALFEREEKVRSQIAKVVDKYNLTLEDGLTLEEQVSSLLQQRPPKYGRLLDPMTELSFQSSQLEVIQKSLNHHSKEENKLLDEKADLMFKLGISHGVVGDREEVTDTFQSTTSTESTSSTEDDSVIGLPEVGIVSDRMQEIENAIADKTAELQQQYVDGRIATEGQLQQAIFEMKFEMYQKELELINMSSVAHNEAAQKLLLLQVKQRTERQKSFEAARDAYDKEQAALKAKQEQEDANIQNIIMNAKTAEEALANLLTMKVNEILLEAMASLWKDGSIPFLAKVGLAVGMKALVTPLINNLLGVGGGGETKVVGSESGEVQFEKGGLTRGGMFKGASHANGGVKFRVGGAIHEAEGGEAIINKKSTARFRPILSAINSYNGNGVKFADGGIISQGEKFAMGGELRSVQSMISGSTTQKVVLVESDVTNTQNRISALESQSSF